MVDFIVGSLVTGMHQRFFSGFPSTKLGRFWLPEVLVLSLLHRYFI